MKIPAGSGYTITIEQIERSGYPRVVRLYKRGILGKRRVSSDWFLNAEQAQKFAEQLAEELKRNSGLETIRSRPPGWILKRASR